MAELINPGYSRARTDVLVLEPQREFGTHGDGDRRLATRPPALPDGAFAGTSLLPLVAVFNWRVLGLSPSHGLPRSWGGCIKVVDDEPAAWLPEAAFGRRVCSS